MKKNIIDQISPNEALIILRQLAKSDKGLKNRIAELAESLIRGVDVDEVCEDVFSALDILDVHILWDRSGETYEGYISPGEMAAEMFEEALAPFIQELLRFNELKMQTEAKHCCMGILKGIYDYKELSRSEFKDWATDFPEESFSEILDKWVKKSLKTDQKEMKKFIDTECPDWSGWASRRFGG